MNSSQNQIIRSRVYPYPTHDIGGHKTSDRANRKTSGEAQPVCTVGDYTYGRLEMSTVIKTAKDVEKFANDIDSRVESIEGMSSDVRNLEKEFKSLNAQYKQVFSDVYRGTNTIADSDVTLAKSGEFFRAVARKGSNAELSDQEVELLKNARPEHFVTKASLATDLTSDATTGSYNVPVEFHREVLKVVEDQSELFNRVMKIPMTSRTKSLPIKNAGIAFSYAASQGDDLGEVNPTFTSKTLTAYTYAMYLGITEEFWEDEAVGIGEYFRTLAADAYTDIFDSEFLTGTGAPTTGLLADTSTNTVSMGTGDASFEDLDVDDLVAMEAELSETKGALKGAHWFMSPYIWNKIRALKDADGNALVAPWADSLARRILGYPVILSYQMPDSSDDGASTAFVALGSPKHLVYGDRVGLEVKYFDATRYAVTNCEAFFRFRFRAAFDVVHPAYFAVLSTAA